MYKTIVVTDNQDMLQQTLGLDIISFEQYLSEYPKRNEPKTRIINLCDTEHYLSCGYYCSLLAEARQHKVLPSVGIINDLRNHTEDVIGLASLDPHLPDLAEGQTLELLVFFGSVGDPSWQRVAKQAFDRYPAPLLRLRVSRQPSGLGVIVQRLSLNDLDAAEQTAFAERLKQFTESVWRNPVSKQRLRWDMAILVNPDEPNPPSDNEAIKRFVKAAAKVGIHAELITAQQAQQIAQYDALFVRETTAIDHHTYRIARRAEKEGMVVIDDPTSILRCCNKVFLHDAFTYNGVPSLKTRVILNSHDASLDGLEQEFSYPMVIKVPEGSFSKGVFKIHSREELKAKVTELLGQTALVLVQEFLYTDFDWRIGVLNGRAIYACRYHMARNHWQIYNHDSKRFNSGGFETLATFEVPKAVLDAALKACKMIGTGLYGVDLKQHEHQVYVIEVNDNPSIDHGVEDNYLGTELYMQIMSEFAQRLERRGRKNN